VDRGDVELSLKTMGIVEPPPIHPSVLRNRDPILAVLRRVLADCRTVLEVGSGGGAHAWYFARHLPHLVWQPTDIEPVNLADIEARRAHEPLENLLPALRLDARDTRWPVERVDAVYSGNMIHIAPFEATLGLMAGAGCVRGTGGRLVTYGPYRIGGAHTAPSNAAFDESLKARDPAWGVRDVEAVVEAAEAEGFGLLEQVPMPANNLMLIFEKR
jgi:hypothetical protein